MKISRFSHNDEIFYGKFDQDKVIRLKSLSENNFNLTPTGETYEIGHLTQMLPVNPQNIYGVGDNYPRSKEDQSIPVIFKKSPRAMVMNFSKVSLPAGKDVWPEPEIGLVIKKELSGLNEDNFGQYILGYILVNDVTCVTSGMESDTHNDESKNQKGFFPVGSFIQTEFDFSNASIFSNINNTAYRNGSAQYFKWSIGKILNELKSKFPLVAGDLIITGCPARLNPDKVFLSSGDVFSSSVEGLGELVTYFEKDQQ